MKIDIVNPMPPKNPAPSMFFHFKSLGKVQSPNPTPINEKSQIPIGFPKINPTRIPMLLECVNPLPQSFPKAMLVLAKANNGKMKNATGLCRKSCKYKKSIFHHHYQTEWQKPIKRR